MWILETTEGDGPDKSGREKKKKNQERRTIMLTLYENESGPREVRHVVQVKPPSKSEGKLISHLNKQQKSTEVRHNTSLLL